MKQLLANNPLILMEAAIVERLRRTDRVKLHETLVNALLIYDRNGRDELRKIFQAYIDIALTANLPFLMCTPTWRANQARVAESSEKASINTDAVHFMQSIRNAQTSFKEQIKIGGLIGCKNDCYQPSEGLSTSEAEQFHSWQINQLAQAGVDFLIAETLPNVDEALGIAKTMELTKVPYMISFVISPDGNLLDGTSLENAIARIDSVTNRPPIGYMVNCAYPTFLCASKQPQTLFKRLIGFQANASSLSHSELDGAKHLHSEQVSDWGKEMFELQQKYGVKILGGCCGTENKHLQYLANQWLAID